MAKIDFIGVGSPLVDILASVDEAFVAGLDGEKGGMELVAPDAMQSLLTGIGEATKAPGGSAANTVIGLAKLGSSCSFLGKLGRDDAATFYRQNIEEAGIQTDRLKYSREQATGQCLSLITPDSERTCRTDLGAAMALNGDEVEVADFANHQFAHIEGYILFNRELTQRVLHCAKSAGCTISLDLASFEVVRANRDVLDDILRDYVDIVFANEDEAEAFCDSSDPQAAVSALSAHCATVAVKLGADGAVLRHKGEMARIQTPTVNAVDSTGAGDLFASGFLYGISQNWNLATCGDAGALLGSTVVQQIGAAIPEDDWVQIREKIS